MRFSFFLAVISFTFSGVNAQNISLPSNFKQGKCYERCFYYDKPVEWKEVECNKSEKNKLPGTNVFTVKKTGKEQEKFISYQKQLINLGYNLDANGYLDEKTIKAHHKYLKFKAKQAKKAKRRNRKNI